MENPIYIKKYQPEKCRKLSIRIREELVEELDRIANDACMSRSELIRILLTETLKRVTFEE